MLDDEAISERLATKVYNFHRDDKAEIITPRKRRIDEAMGWEQGPDTDNPIQHPVDTLPGGHEVHFLKPGKEADRDDGNQHDMTPKVAELYTGFKFDDLWAELSRIGIHDQRAFEYVMVLLYRNAFLIDHLETEPGIIRYRPDDEVLETLEDRVGDAIPGTVRSLLHFIDILGWNEDVKYHGGSMDYNLQDEFYTGRVNTILTCIGIPYKFTRFITDVIESADNPEEISLRSGLESMQGLSNARGVSKPTQQELRDWFGPILHDGDSRLADFTD